MTIGRGPGRPPKIVPKVTDGRRAELEKLREVLWSAMEGATARDTASLASQLRAIALELSTYDPEPESEDDKYLRSLIERREARMGRKTPTEDELRQAANAYSSDPAPTAPAPEPVVPDPGFGGTGSRW